MFAPRAELGKWSVGMRDERKCLVARSPSELNEKPWSAPRLTPLFTELTADKTAPVWARRAVRYIHRFTREYGQPPTFREVFAELATHDPGAGMHQEAWSSKSVRYLTMVHWRRRGWLRFRREPRTLRSGPAAGELFTARAVRTLPTRQADFEGVSDKGHGRPAEASRARSETPSSGGCVVLTCVVHLDHSS